MAGGIILFCLRLSGFGLLLASVVVLAGDLLSWADKGRWSPLSAGQFWYETDRGSLNAAQAITQRYLFPELWDPGAQWVLVQPLWMGCAFFGMMLLLLIWSVRNVLPRPREE